MTSREDHRVSSDGADGSLLPPLPPASSELTPFEVHVPEQAVDDLHDADVAERWGYVNRALDENELRSLVAAVARRIASCPPDAIAHAKAAVAAAEPDIVPGLLDEAHRFVQRATDEEAITRMQRFLDLGGQTRELELDAYSPDQPGDG